MLPEAHLFATAHSYSFLGQIESDTNGINVLLALIDKIAMLNEPRSAEISVAIYRVPFKGYYFTSEF